MTTLRERISGVVARWRGGRRTDGEEGGDGAAQEERLTCTCGAEYRVVGKGRHRVVWPADGDQRDALTSSECPACGHPLDAQGA
jgi:hypothetical protein